MDISRRTFLKGAVVSSTSLAFSAQMASGFVKLLQKTPVDDEGNQTVDLGLGVINTGPPWLYGDQIEPCLKGKGHLAKITLGFPSCEDLFGLKSGAEGLVIDPSVPLEIPSVSVRCSFEKQPRFTKNRKDRMEARLDYPAGINSMTIIFPKASVIVEADDVVFCAHKSNYIAWQKFPFGRIIWRTNDSNPI